MTVTYRTGIDGVTIVAEGDTRGGDDSRPDQLAAVVVNGDQALAERICSLLNDAHTPDVDLARGATEALAHVRRVLDGWIEGAKANHEGLGHRDERAGEECWTQFHPDDIRNMVTDAAAELGVAEDAPSARVGSTETAQNASGVAECTPDAHSGSEAVQRLTDAHGRTHPDGPTQPADGDAFHRLDSTPEPIRSPIWHIVVPPSAVAARASRRRCICNDPPPTVDKPKNGTATRPPGWACPRHGEVI